MRFVWLGSVDTPSKINIRIDALISFKDAHYPKSVILYAVNFCVRFGVSGRDLEEIMDKHGVAVDHASHNRWVGKYAVTIADEAHHQKGHTCRSWWMDEMYIKVKGKWLYLYRALDCVLSERRDKAAATASFIKTIVSSGWPDKVAIDKSGPNIAGLFNMNCLLT